jgi:uncharacterized membrane protein
MNETYKPAKIVYYLAIIAALGFLDALYLSVEALRGLPPPCSLLQGCEIVTLSKYSKIGGVPIAILGALNYAFVLVLLLSLTAKLRHGIVKLVLLFSSGDFLVSLGLVYIQLFVLHAICLYCMFSATVSTLLFLGALWFTKSLKKQPI